MASLTLWIWVSKLQEMVKDREPWRPAVHGVAKSCTWLSDWTELLWGIWIVPIHLGWECSVGYCKYAEVSCSGYAYFLQLWLFPCDESWIKRHRPSKQCLKGNRSIGRTLTDTLPGTGQRGLQTRSLRSSKHALSSCASRPRSEQVLSGTPGGLGRERGVSWKMGDCLWRFLPLGQSSEL